MISSKRKSISISPRFASTRMIALAVAVGVTCILGTGKANRYVPAVQAQSDGSQNSLLGTFTTIDVPGATLTVPLDINAEGYIVGRYAMAGRTHGFLRTPAGEFLTIDFPASSFTVAAGINNLGDIVGMYALPSAPSQRHGYLLKDGVFTSFDPPGSTFTNALGINEQGDIVGRYCQLSTCRPGTGAFRAFVLRDGEYTTLEAPGAIETHAFKILGTGRILGGLATAEHTEEFALWRKNTFTRMSLPDGKQLAIDNGAINERGDIVGSYCDGVTPCLLGPFGNHGFLISGDEFHTIDVPGATSTAIFGINARGDIVGAYNNAAPARGFLLTRSQN